MRSYILAWVRSGGFLISSSFRFVVTISGFLLRYRLSMTVNIFSMAYSVLRSTPKSSMTSRLQSSKPAIKAALSSANVPVSRFYVFVPGKFHIPAALSMAALTSAVIFSIWFLLPQHCYHGFGQAVPLSFCRHSPSAGLWRHGFYILFRWIPCIRTATQCTVPKEREVPFGVLSVLQKIEIHLGGHLSPRPLDGQMPVSLSAALDFLDAATVMPSEICLAD